MYGQHENLSTPSPAGQDQRPAPVDVAGAPCCVRRCSSGRLMAEPSSWADSSLQVTYTGISSVQAHKWVAEPSAVAPALLAAPSTARQAGAPRLMVASRILPFRWACSSTFGRAWQKRSVSSVYISACTCPGVAAAAMAAGAAEAGGGGAGGGGWRRLVSGPGCWLRADVNHGPFGAELSD